MKFTTETGSVYEFDLENKRVRRLVGIKDPTPRQGTDGEWKEFEWATDPRVGQQVLICWKIVEQMERKINQSTQTSRVTQIDPEMN